MKILFLDIDGVLVTRNHQIANEYKELKDNLPQFDPLVVKNILDIQSKTDCQIVITSTWRTTGLENLQKIFKKRGIKNIFDVTPIGFEFRTREEEIKNWLYNNDVDSFLIIDDMEISDFENFIKCDPEFGLVSSKKSIEILNGH